MSDERHHTINELIARISDIGQASSSRRPAVTAAADEIEKWRALADQLAAALRSIVTDPDDGTPLASDCPCATCEQFRVAWHLLATYDQARKPQ